MWKSSCDHAIINPKSSLTPTLKSELFNDFKTIPYDNDKIKSDFTIPYHVGLFVLLSLNGFLYYYHLARRKISSEGKYKV